MEICPTQAVLPLVGLAAKRVIHDRYNSNFVTPAGRRTCTSTPVATGIGPTPSSLDHATIIDFAMLTCCCLEDADVHTSLNFPTLSACVGQCPLEALAHLISVEQPDFQTAGSESVKRIPLMVDHTCSFTRRGSLI
ncbi:MAG: hypothetical protein R6U98_18355 [Pirellulaceae bacterium]